MCSVVGMSRIYAHFNGNFMRGHWILDVVGMSLVYTSASIGTFMHGVVGMSLVHGTQQILVSTNQNVEPHQWVPGHHPSSFGVIY